MNDKKLILKILEGNNQAFSLLIEKYTKLVYSSIYRLIKNKTEAEDIFQEVFIELHRSAEHLKNDNDISGWLFKVAYNKSISFLRKKNPAKANFIPEDQSEQESVQPKRFIETETPHHKLLEQEAEFILYDAIDQLPEMQKKALLLHKFEDYSHKEIAEQLDISLSSVESLIYRAKVKLRKLLHSYFKKHLK